MPVERVDEDTHAMDEMQCRQMPNVTLRECPLIVEVLAVEHKALHAVRYALLVLDHRLEALNRSRRLHQEMNRPAAQRLDKDLHLYLMPEACRWRNLAFDSRVVSDPRVARVALPWRGGGGGGGGGEAGVAVAVATMRPLRHRLRQLKLADGARQLVAQFDQVGILRIVLEHLQDAPAVGCARLERGLEVGGGLVPERSIPLHPRRTGVVDPPLLGRALAAAVTAEAVVGGDKAFCIFNVHRRAGVGSGWGQCGDAAARWKLHVENVQALAALHRGELLLELRLQQRAARRASKLVRAAVVWRGGHADCTCTDEGGASVAFQTPASQRARADATWQQGRLQLLMSDMLSGGRAWSLSQTRTAGGTLPWWRVIPHRPASAQPARIPSLAVAAG